MESRATYSVSADYKSDIVTNFWNYRSRLVFSSFFQQFFRWKRLKLWKVTKPPPTTYSTLSVTIPPLPRLVTFPVTERMTVPPLPRLETTPMMELKAATEIRPFTVDLDMLELSYGDFIMKKFIYNDLTWTEAKDACDSINGLLPYFNTITDLEGIFWLKTKCNFSTHLRDCLTRF